MIHAPVPPEAWAAEGARSARALDDVAAALVIGSDPQVAALVARALAMAQPAERRVAIGDLVSDLAALRTSAPPVTADDGTTSTPEGRVPGEAAANDVPGEDAGLLQCFRDGLPVSAIARPLSEDGRVFVLPSGGPDVQGRLVMESARWPRLIAGFREVDALLLLVADARTPGLETLMSAVDGVVAVDLPPVVVRSWPLLATVDRPEPELPPLAPFPEPPPRAARPLGRLLLGLGLVTVVAGAGAAWAVRAGWTLPWPHASAEDTLPGTPPPTRADALPADTAPVPDTITIGAVVNPADSANAAGYTVELVAANTPAGANSVLAMRGVRLPAPTLVPVLLGADGRPWYRALTGAWRDRTDAEALLRTLRDRGLVREDEGRVLRAPFALLLAAGVPPDSTATAVRAWTSRGIPVQALWQDDGSVRLFAGAFETPGQSVLVALSLRDIGVEPVLAFRTGRTF